MADKRAGECWSFWRGHDWYVRADETSRFATGIETGRADGVCSKPHRTVFVEVKNGETSWNLTRWTPQQREWSQQAVAKGFNAMIWLSVGKHPTDYDPSKYMPRMTYLIPFSVALEVANNAESLGMKSLPYKAPKSKKNKPSCMDFFQYRLAWESGKWIVPETHPNKKEIKGE